ncbi:MAG TPA: NUDIX domain-containing protein [Streptosporangiaceae bacterium]|jgi:8-oxo-dGTP diphosphatase
MADPGEIGAAGAVLYRHSGPGLDIGLIHRIKYDDWSYPKGKTEPGEHVLATAVREVAEETGIDVVLGRKLGQVSYQVSGRPKRVDFWAGRPAAGAGRRFAANAEVDELIWLPLAQARAKLSYQHDTRLLDELVAGPADTTPLILLRHGSAGSKSTWAGDDLDRPLDERGIADARQLAGLLACFGRCQVISSAARRCVATVEPYADQAGTQVRPVPELTVAPGEAEVAAGNALAISVADRGEPAVLCGHGENLAPMLTAVCEHLGVPQPAGPALRKGAFWVLHLGGGTLAGAEQYQLAVTVDA